MTDHRLGPLGGPAAAGERVPFLAPNSGAIFPGSGSCSLLSFWRRPHPPPFPPFPPIWLQQDIITFPDVDGGFSLAAAAEEAGEASRQGRAGSRRLKDGEIEVEAVTQTSTMVVKL